MKKVLSYMKEHFVETIGLIVIILLVIFISYLKFYKKTFTCDHTGSDGNVKVYEKYIIEQKKNNIKEIKYKYEVTSPSKSNVKEIYKFYEELIDKNPGVISKNYINLKYKDNKLTMIYKLSGDDLKENDNYKSTKHLVKVLKASGFTCK